MGARVSWCERGGVTLRTHDQEVRRDLLEELSNPAHGVEDVAVAMQHLHSLNESQTSLVLRVEPREDGFELRGDEAPLSVVHAGVGAL